MSDQTSEKAQPGTNGEVWALHGHHGVPCSPPDALYGSTPCRLASPESGDVVEVEHLAICGVLLNPLACPACRMNTMSARLDAVLAVAQALERRMGDFREDSPSWAAYNDATRSIRAALRTPPD